MFDIEKVIELFKKHDKVKFILTGCGERECETKNFDLAISSLEKQLNSGWIPVSERLPEEYGCYLVAWRPIDLTAEDIVENTGKVPHYYEILTFEPVFGGGWIDEIEQCDEYEILAWQPLPEPYKEAEND